MSNYKEYFTLTYREIKKYWQKWAHIWPDLGNSSLVNLIYNNGNWLQKLTVLIFEQKFSQNVMVVVLLILE